MKRPDRKHAGSLPAALLLALWGAGCSGINTSVPVTPLMFMQKPAPPAGSADHAGPVLAANNAPLAGP